MEIGPEISVKIRSAIKAKLVELGAYVDEELPDYIMVMVANKKNRLQMTEDLNLFLSANTDKFTAWLHALLTKLQSISGDSGQESKEEKKDKEKERKKSTDKRKSTEAVVETKKKEEKTATKESAKEKADKPTEAAVTTITPEEQEEPEFTVRADTDEFSEELKEIEKQAEAKKAALAPAPAKTTAVPPTKPSPPSNQSTSQERPLAKQSVVVSSRLSSVAPVRQTSAVSARQSGTVMPVRQSGNVVSRLGEKRIDRSEQQDGRSVVSAERAVRRTTVSRSSNVSLKRRAPSSVVTPMVREEVQEEEYDPHNPSVGSVASVIRVTARKSSVPRSLQANKSLLMKAMTDAEKSITVAPKRSVAIADSGQGYMQRRTLYSDRVGRVIEKRGVQPYNPLQPGLTSRSKKQEIMRKMEYTINVDSPVEQSEDTASDEEEVLPDTRMVEVDPEEEDEESVVEEVVAVVDVPSPDTEVVTAMSDTDGVEDTETEAIPLLLAEEGVDDFQLEQEEEVRQKLPLVATVQHLQHPAEDNGQEEDASSRVVKDNPKNTKFIVTLDGVDPNQYEQMEVDAEETEKTPRIAEISPTISPPKVKSFNINLRDSDDEDDSTVTPLKRAKMTEKCRFWPACVNGNSCEYHHPTVPCKTFPSCKFGDKCLYIHPNCKYDARCSKADCPFTHASRRKPATISPPQVIAIPQPKLIVAASSLAPRPSHPHQVVCRFYPRCHNMKCPFKHPKPCRYGLSCAKKSACQFFHPTLPGKDKMTWKSSQSSQSSSPQEGIKAS